MILRCLVDAVAKTERFLQNKQIECHGVIFLRNDINELLLNYTPDRGKIARIVIDWTDPELLREVLKRRFIVSEGVQKKATFAQIWQQICISHIGGEESSQYLIDRCLMRPRCLIDLLRFCRSHAVNLGHQKIEEDDIRQGEEAYSSDLVANIGFEVRDVYPSVGDLLYEFVGHKPEISTDELSQILGKAGVETEKTPEVVELLLWYAVLGFVQSGGDVTYIYTVKYDRKRLRALINKIDPACIVFYINPAFWAGLDIQPN